MFYVLVCFLSFSYINLHCTEQKKVLSFVTNGQVTVLEEGDTSFFLEGNLDNKIVSFIGPIRSIDISENGKLIQWESDGPMKEGIAVPLPISKTIPCISHTTQVLNTLAGYVSKVWAQKP